MSFPWCISVVQVGSCRFGAYYAPAIYEARPRRDGVVTWRRIVLPCGYMRWHGRRLPVGYRSEKRAWENVPEGLPCIVGVRHGRVAAGQYAPIGLTNPEGEYGGEEYEGEDVD